MSESSDSVQGRVSKRAFVARVAKRAGVPVRVASAVYEAAIEELLTVVAGGDRLTLTGFGRFYPQEHKGHRVRFANEDHGGDVIGDYAVLKFSATRDVNRRIGGEQPDKSAKPARRRSKPKETVSSVTDA